MEIFNIILDFVLLFAAIWMVFIARSSGLGGLVGSALTLISIGAIVLGLAHIVETITFEVIELEDVALGELIHRGIVLLGFIFLILGFNSLGSIRK